VSSYTTNASNELTAIPGVTYTYDSNGNALTKTKSRCERISWPGSTPKRKKKKNPNRSNVGQEGDRRRQKAASVEQSAGRLGKK
jgi:hypothetical protein